LSEDFDDDAVDFALVDLDDLSVDVRPDDVLFLDEFDFTLWGLLSGVLDRLSCCWFSDELLSCFSGADLSSPEEIDVMVLSVSFWLYVDLLKMK
jgi:hypothetical protein